jgi:hypothetical protein
MKKKKQLLFLAIAISTALLAARCAKPQTIYIDQDTKDYCLFGEGSYWIFQDSATLKTDSLVITKVYYSIVDESESLDYEEYCLKYSLFNDTTLLEKRDALVNRTLSYTFIRLPFRFPINHFPYLSGKKEYYNLHYSQFVPVYSLGSSIFTDVKIFLYSDPLVNTNEYNKYFYWAKHIGPIKMTGIIGGKPVTFNLIRYNIKPYNK